MMNKDEAVQKLATAGRLSIAHAEDLYDSFFEKPVVPQYVADWYEEHKGDFDYELWDYLTSWGDQDDDDDFKEWFREGEKQPVITLVNMHQFGYEVGEEPRYTVRFKGLWSENVYLSANLFKTYWDVRENKDGCENTAHTRKELEVNGFEWVFNCPGIEVKEVDDGND